MSAMASRMDYNEACSAIASTCREQADADVDPDHRDFWLRQAEER